jgi:phytoene/squalene synthetase
MTDVNDSQRERGKEIHRETGQTFYYATRLLPERIREQTYVLYGFFRIADEVVDDGADRDPATQRARSRRSVPERSASRPPRSLSWKRFRRSESSRGSAMRRSTPSSTR